MKHEKALKPGIKVNIMVVAIFFSMIFAVSAVDATVVVKVDPASQTLSPGDSFSVTVRVENVTYMGADGATLNFDPGAMNVSSVTEGDFLESAGNTIAIGPFIDNTAGTAEFAYSLDTQGIGVNGSGTLATINFFDTDASAEGTFGLILTDVDLLDGDGGTITVDQILNGEVKLDNTPPAVEITAPEDGHWFDSEDVNITFLPWDNVDHELDYKVFVDGVEKASGTAPNGTETEVNLGELSECDHVIRVTVTDDIGFEGLDEITIHVDRTPPTVEIVSPANGSWFGLEDVQVTFHPWDNKADMLDYRIYIDGVDKASGTAPNNQDEVVNLSGIITTVGAHTIKVEVTDYAGKTNSSSVITIYVDPILPTVEIISPANGDWFTSEPVNVTFHPWDNLAQQLNYSVYVDSVEVDTGTATNCSEKVVNLGELLECNHEIRVNVTDKVGNTNSSSVTIHVDRTPPTVTIMSPANDTWFDSGAVVITFHPWDNKDQELNYSVYVDDIEINNGTAANCSEKVFILGGLPECNHVIRVNVTDEVGFGDSDEITIHVDLTPPTVEITSPANGTWFDSEPFNLTFHSCDNKAELLNYSIFDDGTEVANGTVENYTTTNVTLYPVELGDCDHVIRVNVTDMAGKTNSSEVAIHIDLMPPTVEITSPTNDTWFDSELVHVTFHLWDNKAALLNYTVYLDGKEFTNGTAPNGSDKEVALGILLECNHVIRINVTDMVGKTNSSAVTIHVDLTPPTVEIMSPANGAWFGLEDVQVTFHPWDNKADMLEYRIYIDDDEKANGTAANNSDTEVNLGGTITTVGPHTIRVDVTDYAGKTNSSAVITIYVDPILPTVEIISPTNDTWFTSEPVNVTFHPWDNLAQQLNYSIYIDNQLNQTGIAQNDSITEIDLGILPECNHEIRVNVTDKVGNTNSSAVTIHVDRTPPTVTIMSPANDTWFDSGAVNVTFHLWDNKAELLNYSVYLDGKEFTNGTAANGSDKEVALGILPECNHVIRVNVTDYVGKTNSSAVTIHVDLTPPTVEILSPANGTWFDSEPFNLTFHPCDNKAQVLNYSIFADGTEVANGTAENCTTTNVTLYPVELGDCNHVIRVNVTDYAGKTNSSAIIIHVDLTPPIVEITSPANDTWFDIESVNVTFWLWDNKADFLNYSLFLDGVEVENGTIDNGTENEVNLGVLPECNHVITVNATDNVGNVNSSTVTIHVDLTPPTVEIISPANDAWFDSEPFYLTFHSWDNKAQVLNYSIFDDGTEVANGTAENCTTTTVTLNPVELGECNHVLRVNVTDYAGKTNSSAVTIHVDLTPPTVEIISPTNGTWFDSELVNVTFHPWDNKAQVLNYSIFLDDVEKENGTIANGTGKEVSFGVLPECDHVIRINVTDRVGKTNSSAVTIHVDLTPPSVDIISPEEGVIYGTACIRLNFTAEDAGICPSGIAEIYYQLDGGVPVTIPEPGNAIISDVGPCEHTVIVYVKDKVGKENSSSAVSFTLHPGDITGDVKVNVLDLQRLGWAWNSDPNSPKWNEAADLNYDTKVSIVDLQILAWNCLKDYTVICKE